MATLAGRARFSSSARALVRLSWARTMSPLLLVSVVVLIGLPMLLALLFSSRLGPNDDVAGYLVRRYDQFVFALAAPVIGLLLGTSAFSAEAEDGTLLYIVTTTTPRWWIVAVRVAFAAVITAALSALAVQGTGWLTTGTDDPLGVTRAFVVASAFCGATYASLFTAFALTTRRALVVGLGYVIFWEGLLSASFPGLQYLSVRQWALAVAASLTDASNARLADGPSVTVALVGAAAVLLLAVVLGGNRLNRPLLGRIGT